MLLTFFSNDFWSLSMVAHNGHDQMQLVPSNFEKQTSKQ